MASRRKLFVATVLFAFAASAQAASLSKITRFLFRQPDATAPPQIQPAEPEAPLNGELSWRSLAMRDENGVIPVGAIYLANLFRRQQLLNLIPVPGISALDWRAPHALSIVNTGTWTSRGPQNVGGRTRSFLIDPTNSTTMYAGAVSGGMWKSVDSGAHWQFQSNSMANLAIMSMAFDPTVFDRSVIYASTGERGITAVGGPFLRADGIQGAGILKSTDHGITWNQLSSTATWDIVPRIAINSNGVLLAAARRGIYYCNNTSCSSGVAPWALAFASSDANTDANGLGLMVTFDPNNPLNAVAAVLDFDFSSNPQTWRHKILYSINGGQSWTPSTMPSDRALTLYYDDHIELAYAPSQPGLVYANTSSNGDPNFGELWKSTDGGHTFSRIPGAGGATHCTNGACALWVSSYDPNFVVMGGSGGMSRTTDGGATVMQIFSGGTLNPNSDVHADQHLIVPSTTFSPSNPQVYVATDGGLFTTADITTATTGDHSWSSLNTGYQTAQYHGAAGNVAAGVYIGGTQDNGTLLTTTTSTNATLIYDGDGGLAAIDPTDPSYRYSEFQYLNLYRARGGDPPNTVTPIARDGGPNPLTDADPDPYGRANTAAFIGPFVLDAHDPNVMIAAGLRVWKSTNIRAAVPDWVSIRPAASDVILSLAVARTSSDVMWLSQRDGVIVKTENGTNPSPQWTVMHTTASGDNLPKRAATSVFIDPDNSGIVYLTFGAYDGHSLWRSTDRGSTWSPLYGAGSTALPPAPARVVTRHPRNSNVLFVGTDVGIYESDDSGVTWSPSSQGPGDASVYDLRFAYGSDQLVVATHGRGVWTLDTSTIVSNAPTNLVASYDGISTITVSWTPYGGASSYQLFRSSGGAAFAQIGGVITSNSYPDSSVGAGTTYLYKVKAVVGSTPTDFSNTDLATTIVFTDDPLAAGSIVVKAVHLQQVRDATNAVLTAAALPTINFGTVNIGDTIQASDVTTVRTALINAYYSIGLSIPTFSEPIVPASTTVKAIHFQELRNLVK